MTDDHKYPEAGGPLDSVINFEECLRRAARHGARDALKEIGLGDESAGNDVRELRSWLESMRVWKDTAWKTTARVFTLAFWGTLLAGIAHYFVTGGHK